MLREWLKLKKSRGVKPETVQAIRELVKQGYSANRIQKELQHRNMGIQRKRLLAIVRQVKRVPKKPYAEKYVPVKYRRRRIRIVWRKGVAAYGSVGGESRRVQMYGDGKSLYRAMMLVAKHPPKKRFLTISAEAIVMHPYQYLDFEDYWDAHPRVNS